ncbi:hypothetical protein [Streptomyces vastus]|uniref:Uncharacterized protein n=1 Tax=Streptomyces vastus TaxID=285451 RepID=A0ABP6DDQ4_9ACTN
MLALDTYELLRLLDTWLRQDLVPALHDNTRVVLAGREPPVSGWLTDFGGLLRTVPLGSLPPADAEELLRRRVLGTHSASAKR